MAPFFVAEGGAVGAAGAVARPEEGWHFNLFNNAWNTNYALWSLDEEMRFRWNVRVRL